ncbi:hypothetical protein HSB1_41130 [Halogranum salarium B-1]|uniref:Uncharacterized protein n=1 Tax=Halogranum salarium B-1 TaxID=1210908 RepID=J2Z9V2_9EURY|nr:hypothetical protein HSB1_41130 [Halogranum salarium B-1]
MRLAEDRESLPHDPDVVLYLRTDSRTGRTRRRRREPANQLPIH